MIAKLLRARSLSAKFTVCIFTLLAAAAVARAEVPVAPVPATTVPDPNVTRATLTNGLQVIIVRNTLAPVVTTMVNYRVGSDECSQDFPGSAHAMEHMMFRGSPGLTADQLAAVSAAMGGDDNADTQQAITQYFFTTTAENLDVPLRIEATRMRDLLADESLWTKERGAIEQEVARDLSNPTYVFYTQLLDAMFKGSPYQHDALGTRPSFDKTTDADLRAFHSKWYVPNNAVLVIVGDVDAKKALDSVKAIFGSIPPRELPDRPLFNFLEVKPALLTKDTDLPYGMVAATFRFPGADNPDFAAAQILSDVLSSERGKLYDLVPQGKALFSQFEYDTLQKSGLGYAIAGFPAGGDSTNLLASVKEILMEEVTNGFSEELIEAAKKREILGAELQKNSISGLASSWSEAVAGENRNSPDDDINAYRLVTVDDVDRVAHKYIDFDHAITAILTPQPSDKPISSKSYGGAESFASSKNPNVKLPSWAKKLTEKLPQPVSTLNPFTTNLANGLRIIVQTEDVSGTVTVHGRVKNNAKVQMPSGQDGVDEVLDKLFSYGSTTRDRLAFQKALDDIGANESAGTDFSLEVLPENFDRGMELLSENELSPALPEADFTIVRDQLAESVVGELQSPDHISGHKMTEALFPNGDPSQRETTPKTVKSLTIGKVKDYYQAAFRPDLTTIVVIGEISPEVAVAACEKYFGGWTATGAQPNTLFPAVPDNAVSAVQVPDSSRVQVKVTLAQTLSITRTNPDYYALQLGNHVLGSGFYATRLYRDLRENAGLVYYVGSQFNIGLTRGVYQVPYDCDPPNVNKARSMIVRDLKQMQTEKVTDHELHQAKLMLMRSIPLGESSISDIANGWLSRSVLGLPLDEPVMAGKIYLKLKAKDVQAAYAKWLRPDDLVQVTQGPEPK